MAALFSLAEPINIDSDTNVWVVSAIFFASSMVEAYCRMRRAKMEMGVALWVGMEDLAALMVTVSPAAFMPEHTPVMPAQPIMAKG